MEYVQVASILSYFFRVNGVNEEKTQEEEKQGKEQRPKVIVPFS